ncbi:MAG: hypothetical protein GJV46_10065 [Geobacter sp.]|nr:hypothetical protein [Geobacter sp.]
MFKIGDQVRVKAGVNAELPAGSITEVLNIWNGSYPFELLGSFTCFASSELELL